MVSTELFGDVTTLIILSAVVAGVAWRTLGKYWDKIKDGEITSFSPQFLATAIGAIVAAGLPALYLMPEASALFTEQVGQYGIILAWAITAGWAYGINEGLNYSWGRVKGNADKLALQKLDGIVEQKVNEKLEQVQTQQSDASTSTEPSKQPQQ